MKTNALFNTERSVIFKAVHKYTNHRTMTFVDCPFMLSLVSMCGDRETFDKDNNVI